MESFENRDVDKHQALKFLQYHSPQVSIEAKNQVVNKNIEDLKKLGKSKENFNKIYDILNRIATENDYYAMNFAVKEKFYNVSNNMNETTFNYSIFECNYQLAHLIVEFGKISINIYEVPIDFDFFRFILKATHFDASDALIWASLKGHHEVVKLLLTVPGIDINAKDHKNKTALIIASLKGHQEVVKFLLSVPGIDVNAKDRENKTALIWASWQGYHEVVKLLLTVPGIDVNAKDNRNETALIKASRYDYHEVVKLLLSVPGIDVNAKDNENKTALMIAAMFGYHEVVKLLLTVPGIDVNAKDSENKTALMIAAMFGHHEVVKLLLTFPGIETEEFAVLIKTAAPNL